MKNRIEDVIERLILSKDYPDQESVFFVFSLNNRDDLFQRARKAVYTSANSVSFQMAYKDRYLKFKKKKIYFINTISDYNLYTTKQVESFFYDDSNFLSSRTFFYCVRPKLHYGNSILHSTFKVE